MATDDPPKDLPTDLVVPEGRSRLGLAHAVRVTVAGAISTSAPWVRRCLSDKRVPERQRAHVEIVERIAIHLERSFRITWHGADDASENAYAPDVKPPLFGGAKRDG
ncbi:hypothetical protein [Sphingomonas sp.]|uniref:hypothetical protein n=1 Tax=Sphingomonas sp. TaxID=28214 RepID=UPI0025E9BD03|nr:hypothetical protein [Sphingomonas sp.]MBV9527893.1 hypothetical protein [Sphingomonas sp.]